MIIGLHGLSGSGKSELARFLVDECGFELVKFASPLKNMLRQFYWDCGLTEEEIERRIEGDLKEVPCFFLNGKTPRHAMQTLGTEWGRDSIGQSFWINRWGDKVQQHKNVVVDDVRFDNEAKAIKERGGEVLHIVRGERSSDHASENGISPELVAFVIENNGTISDLRIKALDLLCPSWDLTYRPLRGLF